MVIFFDLDDTLVDSQTAVAAAVSELHATLHIDQALEDFALLWTEAHSRYYPRYLEGTLSFEDLRRSRVRHVLPSDLSDDEADAIFATYFAAYENNWAIFEDVLPCLDRLRAYSVGVISNGPSKEQRRKLARFGIDKRFQTILISEECGCPKPNAGIFARACEMAGVAPADAVYVGDHFEIDVCGSRAAGLRGIWLNRKAEPAALTDASMVRTLSEIPSAIASA